MASSGLPGRRELLLGPLGSLVRVIRPCNLRLPKKKKKKIVQDSSHSALQQVTAPTAEHLQGTPRRPLTETATPCLSGHTPSQNLGIAHTRLLHCCKVVHLFKMAQDIICYVSARHECCLRTVYH